MIAWFFIIFRVIMYLIAGVYVIEYFWPLGNLSGGLQILVAIFWPIVVTFKILPIWIIIVLFFSGISIKVWN